MILNPEQIERYSRQLILPGWGLAQQHILTSSSVLVSSSLPSAVLYLAAAGVGRLGLLPRSEEHLRVLEHCKTLNPDCRVFELSSAELAAIGSGEDQSFLYAIVEAEEHHQLWITPAPADVQVLAVDSSRRVICRSHAGSVTEFPLSPTTLIPTELAAGTAAAALLLRILVGYESADFPDRLAANFGCPTR